MFQQLVRCRAQARMDGVQVVKWLGFIGHSCNTKLRGLGLLLHFQSFRLLRTRTATHVADLLLKTNFSPDLL